MSALSGDERRSTRLICLFWTFGVDVALLNRTRNQ